jgi:hypothetical protein
VFVAGRGGGSVGIADVWAAAELAILSDLHERLIASLTDGANGDHAIKLNEPDAVLLLVTIRAARTRASTPRPFEHALMRALGLL